MIRSWWSTPTAPSTCQPGATSGRRPTPSRSIASPPMSKVPSFVDRVGRWAAIRFPSGTRVGDALRAVRRRLPRKAPEGALGQVIYAFARAYPRAFVVQVGAHDGSIVDPLRAELVRRPWSGILVEPVPYVFARLRASYGRNSRLALEN